MLGKQYYRSQFPESLFTADEPALFSKRVIEGYDLCSTLKVVICGLCRDVEKILPSTIARIERTRSFFSKSNVIIVENDSFDNTAVILNNYERQTNGVKIISPTVKDKTKYDNKDIEAGMSFLRMSLMSTLRNVYLDELHEYSDFDYVIMVDMDLDGGWSYEGLLSCFSFRGWSGMGSNGLLFRQDEVLQDGSTLVEKTKRIFYDTWAFREAGQKKFKGYAMHESLQLEKGEAPILVDSVFSGLGIYRIEDTLRCEYRPFTKTEKVACEHVSFNAQIRKNGGKIFINPSMTTLYSPTEYSP
jgi:hypothetical protein